MPLGVELVAGWVNTLSLPEIADEVQRGIDIFETDLSDVPDRHRSVRTTFERTWDWLTEDEKAAFAKLSVFRGGFTKQAALSVAETHVRTLRRLAQKALIRFEGQDRYAIHELLRQFGASKLAESGDFPSTQARHARCFAEFMSDRKQDIKTNQPLEALTLIDKDFENIRTAWAYLIRHQYWTGVPDFLFSLWFFCNVRARGQDALWLLEQATPALQQSPSSRETELVLGQVMTSMAWFQSELGSEELAAATADEALRILHRHDIGEVLLFGLYVRQRVAAHHFQPEVVVNISKEGASLSHSLGDQFWEGLYLPWAGAGPQNGEVILYGNTLQYAEKAVSIFKQLGNDWGIMMASEVLGMAYANSGLYEQAQRCLEDALTIAEDHRDTRQTGNIYGRLAWIAMVQEDFRTAHMLLRKKLRAFWGVGYGSTAHIVFEIVRVYAAQRDDKSAAAIIATIEHLPIASSFATRHLHMLRQDLQNRLEPEEVEAAWAQGRGRSLSELVSELLSQPEFQSEVSPSSGRT
jgi:tetratricopeptide (TPR) repeat protein